jgi:hypothetical protein
VTDPRAAAEVLVLAHQVHGTPPARRGSSPSAPPSAARAPSRPSSPAPARPAEPAGRARPGLDEDGRPLWMEQMQIPLNGLPDSTLDRLEKLGPGYLGWGREEVHGPFFVDVDELRYRGRSLLRAIAAAERREGGVPRQVKDDQESSR